MRPPTLLSLPLLFLSPLLTTAITVTVPTPPTPIFPTLTTTPPPSQTTPHTISPRSITTSCLTATLRFNNRPLKLCYVQTPTTSTSTRTYTRTSTLTRTLFGGGTPRVDNTAMPSWSRTTIYTTLGEESSGSVGSGMESGESTAGGDGDVPEQTKGVDTLLDDGGEKMTPSSTSEAGRIAGEWKKVVGLLWFISAAFAVL